MIKKFSTLFLLIHFLTGCILFKESDLDPESNLSLLYALFRFNQKYEWKWEYKYVSPVSPTALKIHHVSKLPNNYEVPSVVAQAASEYHYASFFQNADGITRFYFNELGRYQIDTYDGNTILIISSAIIDIKDSNQKDVVFLFNNASNTSTQTSSLGVQRISKRPHESFQAIASARNPGYYKGYHYFIFSGDYNKELFVQNNVVNRILTTIVTRTSDGDNWETVVLKDLRFNFSLSNNVLGTVGKSFFHLDSLVIPSSKSLAGNSLEQYLIQIPLNDFTKYQFFPFNIRNAGFDRLDFNKFYSYQDQILYKEYSSTSSPPDTWYRDNNFIQSGSSNIAIPSPNALETTTSPVFINNGILLSSAGTGVYSTIQPSFVTATAGFSHSSPSGSTNMILFGNENRMFQFDPFTSPPTTIRISSVTDRIQSTPVNIVFSGSIYSNTYNSSVGYSGSSFDETSTYIDFTYDTNQVYLKVDHASGATTQFTVPSPLNSYPSFTEAKCKISDTFNGGINSLSIGGGRCLCVKVPSLTDSMSNTFDDPRIVMSKCIDSNNWTAWEEPKIYPIL